MTLVWSWEDMDFIGEEELSLYPLVADALLCDVCGLPDTDDDHIVYVCYACGNQTHVACGLDTETSGGYDRDPDENYWLCRVCLADEEPFDDAILTDPTILRSFVVPFDDVDPFEETYELP